MKSKILSLILVIMLLLISYSMGCTDDEKKPKVFPELEAPVAVIDASATRIIENETIVFNSSRSYDSDGEITTYIWDFGDGFGETTNSTNVSHQYEKLNSNGDPYNVTLTVIDDHSQDNKTSINITVIPLKYRDNREVGLLSRDNLFIPSEFNLSFEKQPFDANFTLNLSLTGGSVPIDIKAGLSVTIMDPENRLIYGNDYNITVSTDDSIYLSQKDFSKAGEYHVSMVCTKGGVYVDYDLIINYL